MELLPFKKDDFSFQVEAGITRSQNEVFKVSFQVCGKLEGIFFPEPVPKPSRKDGLWKSTCFEFFFSPIDSDFYWEVNLSPSGNWNVYRFDLYRTGLRQEKRISSPRIQFTRREAFKVDAVFSFSNVDELRGKALVASLTSVIDQPGKGLSYWALKHGTDQPDFHNRSSFILPISAESPHN